MLGLRSLKEHCAQRLGSLSSSLQVYTFDQVRHQNTALGKCWLILDGMILDVTRWLPQHPGGDRIIPRQALNMDCARFFEMYHASRESFLYLKEFYLGELDPRERPFVDAGKEPASPDFLTLLRQYTPWRMQLSEDAMAFKNL